MRDLWSYLHQNTILISNALLINAKKAVFLLGGKIEKVEKFVLEDNQRSFVFIKKEKNTGKKYPRKAGLPTKEPLGQ